MKHSEVCLRTAIESMSNVNGYVAYQSIYQNSNKSGYTVFHLAHDNMPTALFYQFFVRRPAGSARFGFWVLVSIRQKFHDFGSGFCWVLGSGNNFFLGFVELGLGTWDLGLGNLGRGTWDLTCDL